MSVRTRRDTRSADIWPGFVDALSTLLMVIIFLLVAFMLAQYFLGVALSRSDDALDRLSKQVAELADLLSLERQANAGLRLDIAQLSAELQSSLLARDELSTELTDVTAERDALSLRIARLTSERDELSARLTTVLSERDAFELRLTEASGRATEAEAEAEALRAALAEAEQTIEADKETIELRLAELASLRNDIAALRRVRAELEAQVSQLAAVVEENKAEIARLAEEGGRAREENRLLIIQVDETGKALEVTKQALEESEAALSKLVEEHRLLVLRAGETEAALAERGTALTALREEFTTLRDRSKALEARLADEEERTALAQKEIEERDIRLGELAASLRTSEEDLLKERNISAEALAQVELLNRQVAALRQQLARIEAALEAAEAEVDAQQVTIANLGERLNLALAGKVEELQRYRSEFFGRLRELLGNRPGIRVEGDRFVFQSEVLFASGSAEIGAGGQAQLAQLADTLIEISEEIPPELNWILRIDGHTDKRPIRTAEFPSNWELSTARAMSVVRFLISRGVPPHRLAPTGFGEFQPIDAREDEIGYRRNRRIELKLTNR